MSRQRIGFVPGGMHKVLPTAKHGEAQILHDSPDKFTRLRAALAGQPLDCDVYTRLIVKGRLWMTDADFEWRPQ